MAQFPPVPHYGTVQRCKRAAATLRRYDRKNFDDLETAMIDLVADLRHLADREGIDFYKLLDLTYTHYLEEKQEEKNG